MPVNFLSVEQRENYGRNTGVPSLQDLARYFHLDDADHARIAKKRGDHNRLSFAVQLSTVRYLGIFLDEPMAVPGTAMHTLAKQLRLDPVDGTSAYSTRSPQFSLGASRQFAEDCAALGRHATSDWLTHARPGARHRHHAYTPGS